MNNWYTHYVNETRRHQELIKEADNYRMVKNAFAGSPKPVKAYQRLLVAFGTRLVKWGSSLQARYTTLPKVIQSSTPQPTIH